MNSRLSSISKIGAVISDPGDEFCLEVLAALRVQQVFAPLQTNLAENVKAREVDRQVNPWFEEIVSGGTGLEFDVSHNDDWPRHTRPQVEPSSTPSTSSK